MKPREINRDDVCEGDEIRIEHGRGMSVQGRVLRLGHTGGVEFDGPLVSHFVRLDYVDTKIVLVDRPLPPLPTDEGTVIRRKSHFGYGDLFRMNESGWYRIHDAQPMDETFVPGRSEFDVLVPEVAA